ncbi:MAG: glycosyltransferase family 2 protein [Microgenomates group bacterium]
MEEKQLKLSVALAVYNESENLGQCLESIAGIADEIIVVDGSSRDNTVEIATKYGARVIKEVNRTNFHINKQIAIDACHGTWILQLDADERVSSMLAKEIRTIIDLPLTGQPSAYYVKRRNYFLGRWMSKGGMYPDPVIRFFQRGKARLPQASVHELMTVDGPTKWLEQDLLHIADPTFSRYLLRSNRYTTLQAEEWLKSKAIGQDIWSILLYTLIKPFIRFVEIYLRHKGFQDGFPGFVFALYSGAHIRSSYVKYYEKMKSGKATTLSQDWD